eukprot:NODE_631_length_5203_cov_0.313480.p3 type:complete len:196 gc:universal NODE_631_length_5203_cov_0.313480:3366-2779(-)
MAHNDIKLEILKFLNLNDSIHLQGFELPLLWKYRSIWKSLVSTNYTRQSVIQFLESHFIFGQIYQSCNHLQDLIESVVFMIGLMPSTGIKIELSLLLFMGLLEVPQKPMKQMLYSLKSIYNTNIVIGFEDICRGMCDYYMKLLQHRQKVIHLQVFQLLYHNEFENIHNMALESSCLNRMVNEYELQMAADSAKEL